VTLHWTQVEVVVSHNMPWGVHCLSEAHAVRQVFPTQCWVSAVHSLSVRQSTQSLLSVLHTFVPQSLEL
jgi:hypothetical protein